MNFSSLLQLLFQLWTYSTTLFNQVFFSLPGSIPTLDTNRDIFQLIESRGFQHESHYVRSQGGYILQMVRIINPFVPKSERKH
uniref:Uncharacterized protein n=1 Tax=Sarcoptes scabiei TaxID=52283 RepID=A0A834VE70_SARSC